MDIGDQVFYDPPPMLLTAGQIARAFCGKGAPIVADLRPVSPEGRCCLRDTAEVAMELCPSPYTVEADATPTSTVTVIHELWRKAQVAVRTEAVSARVVTSSKWDAGDDRFDGENYRLREKPHAGLLCSRLLLSVGAEIDDSADWHSC